MVFNFNFTIETFASGNGLVAKMVITFPRYAHQLTHWLKIKMIATPCEVIKWIVRIPQNQFDLIAMKMQSMRNNWIYEIVHNLRCVK